MPIDKDTDGAPTSGNAHFSKKTASFPEMAKNATELGKESGNDLSAVENRSDVDGFQAAQDAEPQRLESGTASEWSNTAEGAPDTPDNGPTIVT